MKTVSTLEILLDWLSPKIVRPSIEAYKIEKYEPEQEPIIVTVSYNTLSFMNKIIRQTMGSTSGMTSHIFTRYKAPHRRPIEFEVDINMEDYKFKILKNEK